MIKNDELVGLAGEAQERAAAAYSGYEVGAALLTEDGQVVTGANVESYSYGLSGCVERVALFKAISAGRPWKRCSNSTKRWCGPGRTSSLSRSNAARTLSFLRAA